MNVRSLALFCDRVHHLQLRSPVSAFSVDCVMDLQDSNRDVQNAELDYKNPVQLVITRFITFKKRFMKLFLRLPFQFL